MLRVRATGTAWKLRNSQEHAQVKESRDKRSKNIAAAAKKRVDTKLKRKGLPQRVQEAAGKAAAGGGGAGGEKETRKQRRLKKKQGGDKKRRPGFEGKREKGSLNSPAAGAPKKKGIPGFN